MKPGVRRAVPTTFAEALKLAYEQQSQIEANRPKIEFYDAVADSSDLILIREAAKVLAVPNLGQNTLFRILRDTKILMSNNEPYQVYVDKQYFMVRERKYMKNLEPHVARTTMVTQKGLDFLRRLVVKNMEQGQYKRSPARWELPDETE